MLTQLEIDGYVKQLQRIYRRHDHAFDRMWNIWEDFNYPNDARADDFAAYMEMCRLEVNEHWDKVKKEIGERYAKPNND